MYRHGRTYTPPYSRERKNGTRHSINSLLNQILPQHAHSNPDVVVHADNSTTNGPQVLEYLNKKGYSKTEATLRREVADRDSNGAVARKVQEKGWERFIDSYGEFDLIHVVARC